MERCLSIEIGRNSAKLGVGEVDIRVSAEGDAELLLLDVG